MSSNKAVRRDEISVNILKANIDILSEPLQKIFDQSFFSGVFSAEFEVGRVLSIHKGDDFNSVENYCPITILPAIDILFEIFIANRIIEFIEKYQILASQQHGFRKNYSTNTAVHSVTKIINKALDKGQITIGLFLNIKKAYYRVDHTILLNKLERYG